MTRVCLWATWFLLPLLATGCSSATPEPTTEERIARLEKQVQEQRRDSEQSLLAYTPEYNRNLGDRTANAAEILRQLPGVAEVKLLVYGRGSPRIIQLCDWHFVPRDLFAVEVRSVAGKTLSEEEVDALWREHLFEVELVQLEQLTVLRCLAKHHGLRQVLCEGLTPRQLDAFKAKVAALRKLDEQVRELRRELEELSPQNRAHVQKEFDALANELRLGVLEIGAAGELAMSREVEVLPLDDEELLDQAKPVKADGTIRLDQQKVEARHHAQVKAAVESGNCSLLILGGAHDLSASVKGLIGTPEYIRVTTTRYKEFSGARENRQ